MGVDQGEGEEEVVPDGGLAAGVVDPARPWTCGPVWGETMRSTAR